ncbi:MAG: glutamine-hydrolyzing GMP synthase, partial [Deltaproteobacteria bacterium]|nr:glutamine-hydrolyzing GMP synthase [Deltaproteobacteria bacterium]
MRQWLGGEVKNMGRGEFGKTTLQLTQTPLGISSPLLAGLEPKGEVWMSHSDTVLTPPPGFTSLATTALCPVAAMAHESKPMFGLQFHPEVRDSPQGERILRNFALLTGAASQWTMQAFMEGEMEAVKQQVGGKNVLMFLSGGVDSMVAFALLVKALGEEKVLGLYIDNGFMRLNETPRLIQRFEQLGFHNVRIRDASTEFLKAVEGMVDPQEKRKAVGDAFIRARNGFLSGLDLDPDQWMLGQGTLYPDIIESGGSDHAEVIKFHHNRVEGIQDLIAAGHVVEPLKDLYKDEVRLLGEVLGLPSDVVWRHPFPGPGLSINVLCAHGDESFEENRETQIRLDDLLTGGPYRATPLPVKSVGVQGDGRTYTPPVVLTGPHDWGLLEETSIHITNSLREVNRVVNLLAPAELPPLKLRQAYCTRDRLDLLRRADDLANKMLMENNLMRQVFQMLVVLLPLSADGNGDSLVLRPVVSEDVMTARFARLDWSLVDPLAQQLLALPGVSAVFYDVTHKPPATFGWE